MRLVAGISVPATSTPTLANAEQPVMNLRSLRPEVGAAITSIVLSSALLPTVNNDELGVFNRSSFFGGAYLCRGRGLGGSDGLSNRGATQVLRLDPDDCSACGRRFKG